MTENSVTTRLFSLQTVFVSFFLFASFVVVSGTRRLTIEVIRNKIRDPIPQTVSENEKPDYIIATRKAMKALKSVEDMRAHVSY